MSSLDQAKRNAGAASREAFVEQEFHAGRDLPFPAPGPSPAATADVIAFWRQAGPSMWFAKDADFDRRFREAFLREYEAAARGELDPWMTTPEGALALVLLLDQFPRNSFRGTPRMYATDADARRIAAWPSMPAMTGKFRPISGYSSTCRLRIRKSLPIRTARWRWAVI